MRAGSGYISISVSRKSQVRIMHLPPFYLLQKVLIVNEVEDYGSENCCQYFKVLNKGVCKLWPEKCIEVKRSGSSVRNIWINLPLL